MPTADHPGFDPCPDSQEGYQTSLRHLQEEFGRWAEATGCASGADILDQPLHYKWGYVDEHLTRWTCDDLDEILLELYPAKVLTDEPETILPEFGVMVDFLAGAGLLDEASDRPEQLHAHLDAMEGEFLEAVVDPERFSFGKRVWAQALDEGVDLGDEAAIGAFIQRFNERPFEDRAALMGGRPPLVRGGTGRFGAVPGSGRAAHGRATPPGTPPRRPRRAKGRRR